MPLFAETFIQVYFECWNITILSASGGLHILDCLLGQTRTPPFTISAYGPGYKLITSWISGLSSFPQLLRRKTDIVASYRVVPYLQHCYAWVVTSSAVHNYWKCYINIVTRTCSGFYWYIRTLPRALRALGSRVYTYISQTPRCCVTIY